MKKEIWKSVKDYEDRYEISNTGRLRNKLNKKEKSIVIRKSSGAEYFALNKNGKTKMFKVERLISEHFNTKPKTYEDIEGEKWVDIKEFKGVYMVSNLGRVKSLDRYINQGGHSRYVKGKVLSLNKTNGKGYKVVSLQNGTDLKPKNYYIHILVAKHFIYNKYNKSTVNHIDGDKNNNCVENLEWATQSEQMKHAYKLGLNSPPKGNGLFGEKSHTSKLKEYEVLEIFDLANCGLFTQQYIADIYNTSRENVGQIKRKKTWKHVLLNY